MLASYCIDRPADGVDEFLADDEAVVQHLLVGNAKLDRPVGARATCDEDRHRLLILPFELSGDEHALDAGVGADVE